MWNYFIRCKKNPTLTVDDWPYQASSVFNSAAAIVNGITLLMVRVEDHRGFFSPYNSQKQERN